MTEWYYRDAQSRKIGPLSNDEFEQRVAAGEIHGRTRVWRSGLPDWTTYAALLAYEANCMEVATGPTESMGPQSSSHCTQVALGASATNRPPTGGCTATPAATPRSTLAPALETCPGCWEDVPAHLLREVGQHRLCGFCTRKHESRTRRNKLREAKGVDSNWLGKFLLRCALIASAFVLGRVILFEVRHAFNCPSLLPTVEAPAVFSDPASLAPAVPLERESAATPAEVALPPDVDPVPPAGR